jgi:hypothetical protein
VFVPPPGGATGCGSADSPASGGRNPGTSAPGFGGGGTIDVGSETMGPLPGNDNPEDGAVRGLDCAPATGGNSSDTAGAAPFVPNAAPRGCTDCSTRSPSIGAPTLKPRAGLPSTAINAKPMLSPPSRGAATPSSLKREASAGSTGAVACLAGAGAPRTAVRSLRGAAAVVTGTVYDGAVGDDDHKRSSQKTALAATAAQITNASKRIFIGPL